MTAIADFIQIAEILLGRTPTNEELQQGGVAVDNATVDFT